MPNGLRLKFFFEALWLILSYPEYRCRKAALRLKLKPAIHQVHKVIQRIATYWP